MGTVINDFRADADGDGCGKRQEQTVAERHIRINRPFAALLGQLICIRFMGNRLMTALQERTIAQRKSLRQIDLLLLHPVVSRHLAGRFQFLGMFLAIISRQRQDVFLFIFRQSHGQTRRRIDAATEQNNTLHEETPFIHDKPYTP